MPGRTHRIWTKLGHLVPCQNRGVLLLYDADCGFCRWAVAWALDRDGEGRIEPVPIGSDRGAELLWDLAPAQRISSVHLITADRGRLSGGAAVSALLQSLPNRNLARLAATSPRATGAGYRFVARHRRTFSRLVSDAAKHRADRVLSKREAFPAQRRP